MNVLWVPHVGETYLEQVVPALHGAEEHGWKLQLEPLGFTTTAYWKSLCSWWLLCAKRRRDLMIVEHDVVIHDGVFESFESCPLPVCAFTYWQGGDYEIGLGCTRFRAELVHMHRDAMERAGRLTNDGCPEGYWKRLDTRVWQVLGPPHRHEPPVRHLHPYPRREPA